jgi:hypothetical protein
MAVQSICHLAPEGRPETNVLSRLGIADARARTISAARKKTSQRADDFAGTPIRPRADGPFSRWTETCS